MSNAVSQFTALGRVAKLLSNTPASADALQVQPRLDAHGGTFVTYAAPSQNALCEEGSILLATNPTIGTGVTWPTTVQSYSDTAGPNFYIQNNAVAGGASIHLLYIIMVTTAAGTAAVSWNFVGTTTVTARVPTTVHNTASTIVNSNNGQPVPGAVVVQHQSSATASVWPASVGAQMVSRGSLGGLNVAGDEMRIIFGEMGAGGTPPLTAAEGATATGSRISCQPAVVLAPGVNYSLTLWAPSSSAAFAPEFIIGMAVR
jgi:hypothetical protein